MVAKRMAYSLNPKKITEDKPLILRASTNPRKTRHRPAHWAALPNPSNSTSKTSTAFGGITPAAPRGP